MVIVHPSTEGICQIAGEDEPRTNASSSETSPVLSSDVASESGSAVALGAVDGSGETVGSVAVSLATAVGLSSADVSVDVTRVAKPTAATMTITTSAAIAIHTNRGRPRFGGVGGGTGGDVGG